MPSKQLHRLADLQLAIMRVLWADGEATVSQVHALLQPERGLAPTPVATMLKKMEVKGVVSHRVDGRQFVYRARVQPDNVRRTMVGDLVDRLFQGNSSALVAHLIEERGIDPDVRDERRQLLDRARTGSRSKGDPS